MRSTRLLALCALLAAAGCPDFGKANGYCQTWKDCPEASAGSYQYCNLNTFQCGTYDCLDKCSWRVLGIGKERYLCDLEVATCGYDCRCPGTCDLDAYLGSAPAGECSVASSMVPIGEAPDAGIVQPPKDAGTTESPDGGCVSCAPVALPGTYCGSCGGATCNCDNPSGDMRCALSTDKAPPATCCVIAGRAATNASECCSTESATFLCK